MREGADQDHGAGLTRRNMLRGLGIMAAAAPAGAALPVAAAETAGAPSAAPPADLLDEHFTSSSGRHFSSQLIHSGEQAGYQVTPISQDKCAPGYQRPGNLGNPTVAALLRKGPFRRRAQGEKSSGRGACDGWRMISGRTVRRREAEGGGDPCCGRGVTVANR